MSKIGLDKVKNIGAIFLDERIIPAIGDDNSLLKWGISGVAPLVLARSDTMLNSYIPTLQLLGIVDDSNHIDTEALKTFIDNAFDKQPTVRINIMNVPFKFNIDDGKALLQIIDRFKE